MMILYHGSNVEIEKVDLSKTKLGKDFGKGFYLNPNFEQARQMAIRTRRTLGFGNEIVNGFSFDDSILNQNILRIKIFPDYNIEGLISLLKIEKIDMPSKYMIMIS